MGDEIGEERKKRIGRIRMEWKGREGR